MSPYVPKLGFEPKSHVLQTRAVTCLAISAYVAALGLEPKLEPYESSVLPLYQPASVMLQRFEL